MAEWSKALSYATPRKWSGFKIREHHQGLLFVKFYFKDFKHFDDARVFWGFEGIFKNEKYLNSTLQSYPCYPFIWETRVPHTPVTPVTPQLINTAEMAKIAQFYVPIIYIIVLYCTVNTVPEIVNVNREISK